MIFLETSHIINLTVLKSQSHEKAKEIHINIKYEQKVINEMVA